jgi:hypothetical protein
MGPVDDDSISFNGFHVDGDDYTSIVSRRCVKPEYHIYFTYTGIEEYLRTLPEFKLIKANERWYIFHDRTS